MKLNLLLYLSLLPYIFFFAKTAAPVGEYVAAIMEEHMRVKGIN
jgi:hypothetical protein